MQKADFRRDLGGRIRDIRKNAGMTQADFAQKIGISRIATLSSYETGKTEVPLSILLAITEVFDISISVLVPRLYRGHTTDMDVLSGADRQFLRSVADDPRRLDAICELIELLSELPPGVSSRLADILSRLTGSDLA